MAVREVKVCLLGESGVGKSSIVNRFVHDSFRGSMESTIGASFLTKTLTVDGNTYKFQIWDTAGQEKYRALAPMYYRGAAAAIVVYDISRESSFTGLRSWVNELKKHGPPEIVLAIAGNKCDLEEQREVTFKDAVTYAETSEAVFVETSAKTAVNIGALFVAIGKRLPQDDFSPSHLKSNSIQVDKKNSEEKSSCCSSSS